MHYQTKTHRVRAIRMETEGELCFAAGEWVVFPEGAPPEVVTDEVFHARYEATEPPAPAPRPRGRRPRRGGAPAEPVTSKPAARAPSARAQMRSEKQVQARRLFEGGMSLKQVAEQVGLPYGTIWAWKAANGWEAA